MRIFFIVKKKTARMQVTQIVTTVVLTLVIQTMAFLFFPVLRSLYDEIIEVMAAKLTRPPDNNDESES